MPPFLPNTTTNNESTQWTAIGGKPASGAVLMLRLASLSHTQAMVVASLTNGSGMALQGVTVNFATSDPTTGTGTTDVFGNAYFSFTPSAGEAVQASVTGVAGKFSASPITIPALPTPTLPLVTLEPDGHAFGPTQVGTSSEPLSFTLANNQEIALGILSITIAPTRTLPGSTGRADFTETNTCGGSVPAASSCAISVTFTPRAIGVQSGTLQVHDDLNATPQLAVVNPQTVSLAGTGVAPRK